MPLPEQYKTAIKVMGMMGGNGGDLQTRALRYLYPEKIFQQFEGDNATWTQFDPARRMVAGTAALSPPAEGAGDLLRSGDRHRAGRGTAYP